MNQAAIANTSEELVTPSSEAKPSESSEEQRPAVSGRVQLSTGGLILLVTFRLKMKVGKISYFALNKKVIWWQKPLF